MKRRIKLTERDLTKIIKRCVRESTDRDSKLCAMFDKRHRDRPLSKIIQKGQYQLPQHIKDQLHSMLQEGTLNQNDYQKWETIKETLGTDKMVDDIYQYLDSRMIEQLIEYFNQDYDLFEDEDEDDEYDEDDDIIL